MDEWEECCMADTYGKFKRMLGPPRSIEFRVRNIFMRGGRKRIPFSGSRRGRKELRWAVGSEDKFMRDIFKD